MDHLLWLDMEMTGLDVEKEVPIEVAAIITDKELKSIDNYHSVIKQPQEFIDRMDDWNRNHHGSSGLTAQIPSGKDPGTVENELIQFVEQYWGAEKAILAGNSIGQDRLFINKHLPTFAQTLHYRMLDVTSFKIVYTNFFGKVFEKKNTHRAVDDIQESINELAFYISHIQK